MELDLYWYCICGHEFVTAPSAFRREPPLTNNVEWHCPKCGRGGFLTRADCTTERRVPVGTQLPPDGIIGGEPGVEYVFAPTHDSGATVDGTKLCPLCCGTGYTGNVNDREACERCEGSGIDGYAGKLAALEAERDEARAEVERLKEERLGVERALQTSHDNLDERWSELSEAHSRIAALEAVIKAQSEHAKAIARSNWTAFELSEALHAAGLDAEPVRGDSI